MSNKQKIVGLVGSERRGSSTEIAVKSVGHGVETTGAEFELITLADYNFPPLKVGSDTPEDASEITEKIRDSDGIILGTPVYHGSFSGSLKCAIDYCGFDEFEGKTVGLVAVAGGSFPTSALMHMRTVCRSLNAWVLPKELAVPNSSDNIDQEEEEITNDSHKERAVEIGRKLAENAVEEKEMNTELGEENEGA